MYQKQITVQRQDQERLWAQQTVNTNYCMLSSSLDSLFNRLMKPSKPSTTWKYYDPRESGKHKTLEALFDQANTQLSVFCTHHKSYTQRFKQYDFASNHRKEEIMDHLEKLNSCSELKPLVESIVHIFNQEYGKVQVAECNDKRELGPEDLFRELPIAIGLVENEKKLLKERFSRDPEKSQVSVVKDGDTTEKKHPYHVMAKKYDEVKYDGQREKMEAEFLC